MISSCTPYLNERLSEIKLEPWIPTEVVPILLKMNDGNLNTAERSKFVLNFSLDVSLWVLSSCCSTNSAYLKRSLAFVPKVA